MTSRINIDLHEINMIHPSPKPSPWNDGNHISRPQLADPIRPSLCFRIRKPLVGTNYLDDPGPRIRVRPDIGGQSLERPRHPIRAALNDDVKPRPIPRVRATARARIVAGDLKDDLAHRAPSDPGDGAGGQVGPWRRVLGDMEGFSSGARSLDPVFGVVEDGGDDVRHGETEAGLEEEDGVVDGLWLVTVHCGACQR